MAGVGNELEEAAKKENPLEQRRRLAKCFVDQIRKEDINYFNAKMTFELAIKLLDRVKIK